MSFPKHPEYSSCIDDWEKWRLTLEGGKGFIERYLTKYSSKETDANLTLRKSKAYCPAFAKEALIEIKNAIFNRMTDICRVNGPDSYKKAIEGLGRGVDNHGSDMNYFMGVEVLPEMLAMKRVGVFVDMPKIDPNATLAETYDKSPYLYVFTTEAIYSWHHDEDGNLDNVILECQEYENDEIFHLPSKKTKRFRHIYRVDANTFRVDIYADVPPKAYAVGGSVPKPELVESAEIKIDVMPFVVFEIPESLLHDTADYQIALLNLESSDINYAIGSNQQFYTEQYDTVADPGYFKPPGGHGEETEEAAEAVAGTEERKVGQIVGRRYPKGLERPGFINPSPDPLKVSMEKGYQLREDIRHLMGLTISNMQGKMASAESKQYDNSGLESGLAYIGLVLARGEREIAKIWAKYVNAEPATVNYPDDYSLTNDAQRAEKAKNLQALAEQVPSLAYKKEIQKAIAKITLGHCVSPDTMETITKQIEESPTATSDPKIIIEDHKNGFCCKETASLARGYAPGEAEKAKKDKAEELAAIAAAQAAAGSPPMGGAARGLPQTQIGQPTSSQEKQGKPKRGEAKL